MRVGERTSVCRESSHRKAAQFDSHIYVHTFVQGPSVGWGEVTRRRVCLTIFAIHRIGIALALCVTSACSPRIHAPTLPGAVSVHELDADVHVAGLAVGPGGDAWLATLNYGNGPAGVIRVDKTGVMRRFSRPESFNRVAVDSKDVAWFTVGAGASGEQPKIVRVDHAGQMRIYPLPAGGNFQGITIGPDGAPWFVDAAASDIGRIAADGKITYYGPASSDPTEIIAGRDGNLWFTEPDGNKIGRLKLDGTLDEFNIPTKASKPQGIASGPDGGLWFCEAAANKIGRITALGKFSEFRVPTTDAWPVGIAAAAGDLWFTELATGQIGRISQAGKVAEYAVPGGGFPGPIARGSDGSLWIVSNAKRDAVLGLTTSRSRLIHFVPR